MLFLSACSFNSTNKKTKGKEFTEGNIQLDTLQINDLKFVQTLKNNRFHCLKTISGDTIVQFEDFYFKLEILDLNEDGFKDLRVLIVSNSPTQCNHYLFDTKSSSFIQIKNSDLMVEKIPNTNYYYSYFKTGCAGLDFGSYLSKLENFTFIDIAYIAENGCDSDTINSPINVEVYKVFPNLDQKLLKTYSYNEFVGVDMYWKENYKKFSKN